MDNNRNSRNTKGASEYARRVSRRVFMLAAALNVSDSALAKGIGRGTSYVYYRRDGRYEWTLTDLERIARWAHVTPEQLCSESMEWLVEHASLDGESDVRSRVLAKVDGGYALAASHDRNKTAEADEYAEEP